MGHFEKFIPKGNHFINEVAKKMELEDKEKAYRITRSVFHVLRDHLIGEENLQLIAQLPMMLKALYVEGWKSVEPVSRLKNIHDLYEELVKADGKVGGHDFPDTEAAAKAVKAVIEVLENTVSEGEMEDVKAELPKFLRKLLAA